MGFAKATGTYVLNDADTWAEAYDIISQYGLSQVSLSALDFNRSARAIGSAHPVFLHGAAAIASPLSVRAHFRRGFAWNTGDQRVQYWWPQGVSGTGDAYEGGLLDGRQLVLTSWHYSVPEEEEVNDLSPPSLDLEPIAVATGFQATLGKEATDKGVRVSVVNLSGDDLGYRHLLLVEPGWGSYDTGTEADGTVNIAMKPDFRTVPIHAGGIALVGPFLYVADTYEGFRVFDTRYVLEIESAAGSHGEVGWSASLGKYHACGYRYILPQVSAYKWSSSDLFRFSTLGLDRSGATPSLVCAEYWNSSLGAEHGFDPADARAIWWEIASDSTLASTADGVASAVDQRVTGLDYVQGVVSRDGVGYFARSGPYQQLAGRPVDGGAGANFYWAHGPEGLYTDAANGLLWHTTEHTDERVVFACHFTTLLPFIGS